MGRSKDKGGAEAKKKSEKTIKERRREKKEKANSRDNRP